MPKTFLHQHWQRNRRLYMMMRQNMAGCGICTVTDQNIHCIQDSWAPKTRTKRQAHHDEQQGGGGSRCLREVSFCLVWHLWKQDRENEWLLGVPPILGSVLEWNIWSLTLAKADCACTRKLLEKEGWSRWKANGGFWEKSSSTAAVNIQYTGLNRWLKSLCSQRLLGFFRDSSGAGER